MLSCCFYRLGNLDGGILLREMTHFLRFFAQRMWMVLGCRRALA